MDDVQYLIYNELKELRNDLTSFTENINKRVSALEKFRDKAIGILIAIGVGIRYAWDYVKERII
jgi:hypothetical protein